MAAWVVMMVEEVEVGRKAAGMEADLEEMPVVEEEELVVRKEEVVLVEGMEAVVKVVERVVEEKAVAK